MHALLPTSTADDPVQVYPRTENPNPSPGPGPALTSLRALLRSQPLSFLELAPGGGNSSRGRDPGGGLAPNRLELDGPDFSDTGDAGL